MLIDIGARRELFVDRYLIERLEGARLQLHHPCPVGAVLCFDEPWAHPSAGYGTVLLDGDTYRFYYRKTFGEILNDDGSTQVTCMAESEDGVTWRKPYLGMYEVAGTRDNNVVWAGLGPTSHNFAPFIDRRPGVSPDERYKALAGTQTTGLLGFVSPDGVHWNPLRDEPLLASVLDDYRYDSQNVAFWSEHEGCYVCYYRIWRDKVRSIARAVSDDFLRWSDGEAMGFGDTPLEHLYINQTHPYYRVPHIYVSLAARFMSGRKVLSDEEGQRYGVGSYRGVGYWQDCSEAVLLTSRGGNRYDRTFMEGFVRPGLDRRNWVSRSNYPALGVVPMPFKEGGWRNVAVCDAPQPAADGAPGAAGAARGRLCLVKCAYAGGEMVSVPLRFEGQELELNYATGAAGHVQVELQDASGAPIEGYRLEDADLLIGDEVERVVSWQGERDVSGLSGQAVRVRMQLKDADIYSFRFG